MKRLKLGFWLRAITFGDFLHNLSNQVVQKALDALNNICEAETNRKKKD